MIAGMAPQLSETIWHFCTGAEADPAGALAVFEESEGRSLILSDEDARARGYDLGQPMAQITLTVHSALDGVGLTAAVAGALTEVGISCNVVAAYHHDHVLVPQADAERAVDALRAAQAKAARL